jgi:hypothetical protein
MRLSWRDAVATLLVAAAAAVTLSVINGALLVVDLFVNSVTLLVWTTVALLALWIVATIHHAIEARPHISLKATGTRA